MNFLEIEKVAWTSSLVMLVYIRVYNRIRVVFIVNWFLLFFFPKGITSVLKGGFKP